MNLHIKQLKIIILPLFVLGLLLSCQPKFKEVSNVGASDKMNDSLLKYLAEPVSKTVIGHFKTISPQPITSGDTLEADGFIGFDQSALNMVSTRVTGRIEKLFVKYTNQQISKGQPLMEIYSPELVGIQRNLLQAVQDKDKKLISGLKNQLKNLGMIGSEIKQVVQSGNPVLDITIYSPFNGLSQNPEMPPGMNMQNGSQSASLPIREQQYVQKGETVFAIQNTSRKWAILNIFNGDLKNIREGMPVRLYAEANPQKIIKGEIDFIPPFRKKDEKTSRIRVYLKDLPDSWKFGTLIKGEIAIKPKEQAVFVPLSAVNRLGLHHNVVWVQNPNQKEVFQVKDVATGIRRGNSIQILSGIAPDAKIAEDASFMVDNDSYIE